MARLSFQDLKFSLEKGDVKVSFLNLFYFKLNKGELTSIGKFSLGGSFIDFPEISEKRANNRFNNLLSKGFRNLKNKINGKNVIYIHKNSGIPLIGHIAIGIVDRDTSIIEVKPITSCNLQCIYCSVAEDKRPVDFVIEKDYLAEELHKLVELKNSKGVEINIGAQGEPLLYSPLVDFIHDISKLDTVSEISINTNGTLLTKDLIEKLSKAGLTRVNLSLNSVDEKYSKYISGGEVYDIKRIKKIMPIIQENMELLIAPVWIPGINDDEIPKIIKFCNTLKKIPRIMIQNFLNYKHGRNPVKGVTWEQFEDKLKEWENEYNVKLRYHLKDEFKVKKIKVLSDPFKRGEIVKGEIMGPGRLMNESIGIAGGRLISIKGNLKKGKAKIKIIKIKDHICYGDLIR
ncbi:radical SAM protein [Nanoarchaeota archaeon]